MRYNKQRKLKEGYVFMENKMLSSRMKKLREQKGWYQKDVADKLNIKSNTLSGYENGTRSPDPEMLSKIANLYSVTTDYLLGRDTNSSVLSPVQSLRKIPLIGRIAAGVPIFTNEHIEDYVTVHSVDGYENDELFMLTVQGDSMIGSRIYEGDRVLVKVQQDVENGEIAVVNVNGDEATLKKVRKTESGQTWLIASNDKYDPILIEDENARIVGKVIQVIFEP